MSVGTVDVLKDHAGLCCWNHAFRSAQQRATSTCSRSKSNAHHSLPSSSSRGAAAARRKAKQQQEELWTLMYLSNRAPNN
jgi:hypothetical protein